MDLDKTAVGGRVREARQRQQLTQKELGALVRSTAATINRLEQGINCSPRLLRDVAQALREDEKWLSHGIRSNVNVVAERNDETYSAGNAHYVPHMNRRSRGTRLVPVVSYAKAGQAADYNDLADFLEETIETDCTDRNCFALIIEGDSMEPVIRAGDRVIVMPNIEPQSGDIVVARKAHTHEVFVKLAHFCNEARRVKFTSYNPAYPALEFSRKDFRFIYPVHSMQRVFRRSENGHAMK